MPSSSARDVVFELARDGATQFHASYVAKQLSISTADAHDELARLRDAGLVDAHVEILCPDCDRTLRVYSLGQEIPLGELIDDVSCEGEPFELTENDLFMTYSPSKDLLLQVNKESRSDRAKKKRGVPARLRRISSALRLRSISTKKNVPSRSSSATAPEPRSELAARGLIVR